MIFAGLRIALAVSFIVLVASEFVATKSGIGYLIWNSWELLQVDIMFVGIVTIGILGLITSVMLPGDRAQGHSLEGGVRDRAGRNSECVAPSRPRADAAGYGEDAWTALRLQARERIAREVVALLGDDLEQERRARLRDRDAHP